MSHRPFTISISLLVLDQLHKHWTLSQATEPSNQFLQFALYQNPKPLIWAIAGGILLLTLTIYLIKNRSKIPSTQQSGLFLILTGGFSNIIDYARFGAVIDTVGISTAHLNLADGYIIVGALVALRSILKTKSS